MSVLALARYPRPVSRTEEDPSHAQGQTCYAGWQFSNPDEEWITGYAQELQDFCEAVALDRPPRCGADLARDTILVGYGAYLAADTGRRVDLAPWLAG